MVSSLRKFWPTWPTPYAHAMKDAARAEEEGVLAVGFILSNGGAQGASSSQGPRAAPLAPAEIRLGPAFSRYAVDLSAKSPLSD